MFTKTAVFIFSFIGIFAILYAGINTEFYAYQGSYTASAGMDKETAQRFDLANVTIYSNSGNDNMTYEYSSYYDGPGAPVWQMGLPDGQYFEVWWSSQQFARGYVKTLEFRHTTEVWWGLDHIAMEIYTANGTKIGQFINDYWPIQNYYDANVNASVFQTKTPVATSILVGFNQTKYANIAAAWTAGELNYVLSYEFNQNATMMSIWGLMGALLTFNSPALGLTGFTGTLINAMVAIPFWVMTIILIVKLVFAIIPFVKGVDE